MMKILSTWKEIVHGQDHGSKSKGQVIHIDNLCKNVIIKMRLPAKMQKNQR